VAVSSDRRAFWVGRFVVQESNQASRSCVRDGHAVRIRDLRLSVGGRVSLIVASGNTELLDNVVLQREVRNWQPSFKKGRAGKRNSGR
jgi:hypothetical protein